MREQQTNHSFYQTVVFSDEWQKWCKHQDELMKDYNKENASFIFDCVYSEESDEITPEHFSAFISFCKTL